jgi:hypothetical protein
MIKDLLARNPLRTSHLESSFIVQRRGMAFLAAVFPVAFLSSSFVFDRTAFQTSISAYYWTLDLERNIFVGVLCAVGVFLLLYKGYNRLEDRILDLAGISAAGVAFFPMDRAGDCASAGISAHGVFAVTFFACIFIICIFMSENTLKEMDNVRRRSAFRRAYRLCSGIMIASIALAVLSRLLPKEYVRMLCEYSVIFWFEAIGVWAFSAFWYIKTRELDPSQSWMPFGKKHKT